MSTESDDGHQQPELDPRIQIELEKLNSTTDEINRLELEYDDAINTFGILHKESNKHLDQLSKKLRKAIQKAEPYYKALSVAKQAQIACQKSAAMFHKANEIHSAAKETVALAEQRFISKQDEWQFDNAWQEMLNHATTKVMEAESKKAEFAREHHQRAILFKEAEERVKQLEEKNHQYIIKARPYFDEFYQCQSQLNKQNLRLETIKRDIIRTKHFYAQTLRQLEQISNEIHLRRVRESTSLSGSDMTLPLQSPRESDEGVDVNDFEAINLELNKYDSSLECCSSLEQDENYNQTVTNTATANCTLSDEPDKKWEPSKINGITCKLQQLKLIVNDNSCAPAKVEGATVMENGAITK